MIIALALFLAIIVQGVIMSKAIDRMTTSLNGLFDSLNSALVIVQTPAPAPTPDESAALDALADRVDAAKATVDAALAAHAVVSSASPAMAAGQ